MLFLPILLFIPLVANIAHGATVCGSAEIESNAEACKETAGCFWNGASCSECPSNSTETGQGYYCPGDGTTCAENGGKCSCPFPFYTTAPDDQGHTGGATSINECVAKVQCGDNDPFYIGCVGQQAVGNVYHWDTNNTKCLMPQDSNDDNFESYAVQYYYEHDGITKNHKKLFYDRYHDPNDNPRTDWLEFNGNLNGFHFEVKPEYGEIGQSSNHSWHADALYIADIKCVANEVDCLVFDKHTTCASYDNAVACNKDTNCVYENNICHYKAEYCSSFDRAHCSDAVQEANCTPDTYHNKCIYRDDVGASNTLCDNDIGGRAIWHFDESGNYYWDISGCLCKQNNPYYSNGIYSSDAECMKADVASIANGNGGYVDGIYTVHSIWENIIFKDPDDDNNLVGFGRCRKCGNNTPGNGKYYVDNESFVNGEVTKCTAAENKKGQYVFTNTPSYCQDGGNDDWGSSLSNNPCKLKTCEKIGQTTSDPTPVVTSAMENGICHYDNDYTKFCDRNGCFNINGLNSPEFGNWTSGVTWTYYTEQ